MRIQENTKFIENIETIKIEPTEIKKEIKYDITEDYISELPTINEIKGQTPVNNEGNMCVIF
jgi:hypothetical protein